MSFMDDDIFNFNFGSKTPLDPKDISPNQARSILYVQLKQLSRAMTKYGELLEKNAPKQRPTPGS